MEHALELHRTDGDEAYVVHEKKSCNPVVLCVVKNCGVKEFPLQVVDQVGRKDAKESRAQSVGCPRVDLAGLEKTGVGGNTGVYVILCV
jgi:hypothetical protein